jgi:glycosyltransferase involved in cell wall biosynthesis
VKLLVAGEFYEDKQSYVEQVNRLGIGDNVIVLDTYIPNEEVKYYYSAADVVALPYISATQSGIVQIAYNYDKPVIATDVGGLPEIVDNGKTGYIVPAEHPQALAEAIVRYFIEDKEPEFSRYVQKKKGEYSWERFVETIEEFV